MEDEGTRWDSNRVRRREGLSATRSGKSQEKGERKLQGRANME